MTRAFIIAARRTAVVPRNAAFRDAEVHELAAPVIRALLDDAGLDGSEIAEVVLGNALYGGGNPARLAALAAGLPEQVAALTLDTQCCAGLDAVAMAATRIEAREADAIIAGGVESFSRAPLRFVRPREDEPARQYDQPPFTPWTERDPQMIPAAAALGEELGITRRMQEEFAVESHRKALAAELFSEIVPVTLAMRDAFARELHLRVCARLPLLAGSGEHGVTAATIAVEADAAACVLVVSEEVAARSSGRAIRVLGGARRGGDPERPGLAPIDAAKSLLRRQNLHAGSIYAAEVMEAFAVQAIACINGIGLDPATVNRGGGALARGHPIGASGAILAVRLFHEMSGAPAGATGLAAIAAAGGLGSALLLGE